MPPEPQLSTTEKAALDAIGQTKRVVAALVERIYDSQKKMGVWQDTEEPEIEDHAEFLLGLHGKVAVAAQAYLQGGVVVVDDEEMQLSQIAIEAAIELLGFARRLGADVGAAFVETVIEQARVASESESLAILEEPGEQKADNREPKVNP
jgi:hypothetical protein